MLTHRRVRGQRRHHLPEADVRAAENLRYIRETMEQSTKFTDVPGWGMALIGLTAIAAASLGAVQESETAWLRVWAAEAVIALVIALLSIVHKTRVTGMPLRSGPTKKFGLGLVPPLMAGAMLTVVLQREGLFSALPGTWLILYGAAFVAAGAYAIRLVPILGGCFMVAGTVALLGPAAWGDALLALGFGGLHLTFGLVIARRYGG